MNNYITVFLIAGAVVGYLISHSILGAAVGLVGGLVALILIGELLGAIGPMIGGLLLWWHERRRPK